jgi:hypothetical protein
MVSQDTEYAMCVGSRIVSITGRRPTIDDVTQVIGLALFQKTETIGFHQFPDSTIAHAHGSECDKIGIVLLFGATRPTAYTVTNVQGVVVAKPTSFNFFLIHSSH